MKLNQHAVSKLELENKVATHGSHVPKPPGGPSNGESLDDYKQRLFNWLVRVSGGAGALHRWCMDRSLATAGVAVSVTRQGFKLTF